MRIDLILPVLQMRKSRINWAKQLAQYDKLRSRIRIEFWSVCLQYQVNIRSSSMFVWP